VEDNFKGYMLIAEAAQFLGVSEGTLRNWERAGKIEVHRHPINGYRLFKRGQLETILASTGRTKVRPSRAARSTS
jgi:MerR family transcriptional regulator, copper efflux regulator